MRKIGMGYFFLRVTGLIEAMLLFQPVLFRNMCSFFRSLCKYEYIRTILFSCGHPVNMNILELSYFFLKLHIEDN